MVERSPNLDAEGWVLSGRVAGTLEHVHFVVHTAADGGIEAVAAAASLGGRRVEARSDSAPGVYLIEELAAPTMFEDLVVDPSFTDEDSPLLRPPPPGSGLEPQGPTFWSDPSPQASSASASTVDVLVVTSSWYRWNRGGRSGASARIGVLVAQANRAYANSGVSHRIAVRVFHSMWSEYDRSGPMWTGASVLTQLITDYGGLRTIYGADLLHLVVWDGIAGRCGVASSTMTSANAVGVTADSANCTYTFAHEIGHNFGLQHDRHNITFPTGAAASHLGYGFSRPDLGTNVRGLTCWYTIMAYPTHCTDDGASSVDGAVARIQYFSNLTATHPTSREALGKAGSAETNSVNGPADAATVLKSTMATAAAYQTAVSGAGHVDLDFSGPLDVSPDRLVAPPGSAVSVGYSVINRGTKASAAYTVSIWRQWKASNSAAWPTSNDSYIGVTSSTRPALAAGATSAGTFATTRTSTLGVERFLVGITSTEDVDQSTNSQYVWSFDTVISQNTETAIYAGVAKDGTAGFAFNVKTRYVPGRVVESQPHQIRLTWTPTDQYLRLWVWYRNDTDPDRQVFFGENYALTTFFSGANGSVSATLPLAVWRGGTTKYLLSFRNDGGWPCCGPQNPDRPVTATLSVTYIVPSSSSFVPPEGASMLPDGSGFSVPVELTPLDPDVATALVEEGMRLSPGVGPPLDQP